MNPDPNGFSRETSLLALGHFMRLASQSVNGCIIKQSAFCVHFRGICHPHPSSIPCFSTPEFDAINWIRHPLVIRLVGSCAPCPRRGLAQRPGICSVPLVRTRIYFPPPPKNLSNLDGANLVDSLKDHPIIVLEKSWNMGLQLYLPTDGKSLYVSTQ
jgi:hypothetical protein